MVLLNIPLIHAPLISISYSKHDTMTHFLSSCYDICHNDILPFDFPNYMVLLHSYKTYVLSHYHIPLFLSLYHTHHSHLFHHSSISKHPKNYTHIIFPILDLYTIYLHFQTTHASSSSIQFSSMMPC
jgi:hypothetical protein